MTIRPARIPDALAVARVHVRSWQVAYRGILPEEYLASLQPEERARRYTFESPDAGVPHTLVGLDGDALVGFATVRIEDPAVPVGELAALYVDPEHWDRGFGAALVRHAREELVRRGCRTAHLWLLQGNVRGERFYRLDEWALDGRRRSDRVWGLDVTEVGMSRELA